MAMEAALVCGSAHLHDQDRDSSKRRSSGFADRTTNGLRLNTICVPINGSHYLRAEKIVPGQSERIFIPFIKGAIVNSKKTLRKLAEH